MRTPRLFCPSFRVGETHLDPAETRHVEGSLRLREGDEVELFDGAGAIGLGRLRIATGRPAPAAPRNSKRSPLIVAVEQVRTEDRPCESLRLIVSACKRDRLEWMIEKGTELGVGHFILTRFARSVVDPGASRVEKLRRVAIEACKQCRRTWLPEIATAESTEQALSRCRDAAVAVAHPEPSAGTLTEWLANPARGAGHVAIVIGPEGGFAPEELSRIEATGAALVRLARPILRVETAAIAAAAQWASVR